MIYQPLFVFSNAVKLLITVSVIVTLSACGAGEGQGLDEEGNLLLSGSGDNQSDGGGSVGASGNPNATLDWVQDNVFGGICSLCHTGATPPLGVNWSSKTDSCENVNRPSGEIDTLMEIDPGKPEQSYLVWKLEGAGPSGEAIVAGQMPLNNPPLPADTIQNVKDWISDGTPGCAVPKPAARSGAVGSTSETAAVKSSFDYPEGSWMQVWETSLRVCSTCHSVQPSNPACVAEIECPPRGLVLEADNYYGIVDGRTVNPLDPDSSTLWNRVSTSDPGRRMPPDGYLPLTQNQLDVIRNWILDGAPLRPSDPN